MHEPQNKIVIDVYVAVYSESLKRVLKSGELDVEVLETEAKPWLGNYALLSSERVEEEKAHESRPAKAPRRVASKNRDKQAGPSDGDVGD